MDVGENTEEDWEDERELCLERSFEGGRSLSLSPMSCEGEGRIVSAEVPGRKSTRTDRARGVWDWLSSGEPKSSSDSEMEGSEFERESSGKGTSKMLEVLPSPELRREKELQVGLVGDWKSDSDSAVNDERDERLSSHTDKEEGSEGCLEREAGILKSISCWTGALAERTRSSVESWKAPE